MFWTPCVRIDVPADAPRADIRKVGRVLDELITALETTHVLHLNLALSAAALATFECEGLMPLLDRVCDFAAESRIELLTTAAHGAILPLLPHDEAARQLELTERVHQRLFGDAWHPVTLWPPALAFSHKVAELAIERDYSSILVDEAAMRTADGHWPGDRIDSVDRMPGMFLLPHTRDASRELARGLATSRLGFGDHSPGGVIPARYVITAVDVTPESIPDRPLLFATDFARTTRVEQLFNLFPLSRSTSPLPCSQESTAQELSDGVPFGRWFGPGHEGQAVRWRMMTLLAEALRDAVSRGLEAEPALRELREAVDLSWRESDWRSKGPGMEEDRLRGAFTRARSLLDARLVSEIGPAIGLSSSASASPGTR